MNKKTGDSFQPIINEALLEHSCEGILIVIKDCIVSINPKACELLGCQREDILGESIHTLFSRWLEYERFKRGKSLLISYIKTGRGVQNLDIRSVCLVPEKQYLVYINKQRAEEDTESILQDIQDGLLSSFQASGNMVLLLNQDLQLLNANDTALQLVQAQASVLGGMQPGEVLHCIHSYESDEGCGKGPHCSGCKLRKTILKTLVTGNNQVNVSVQFHKQHGDSEQVRFLLVSTLFTRSKTQKVILLVIDDVTRQRFLEHSLRQKKKELQKSNYELKALNTELMKSNRQVSSMNAALRQSIKKAKESEQLKTAFLANISHEVRTPLNGIIGFLELLNESHSFVGKDKNYMEVINRSSDQLTTIISDLLEISIIETGQLEISSHSYDMHQVLENCYHSYRPRALSKGLNLELKVPQGSSTITQKGDGVKLERAFGKLLDNAIKFTRNGSITFGYTVRDDTPEFYVQDTGIGLAAGMLQSIFEAFRQLEVSEHREFGGLGLGLPIVKAWVEAVGGTMRVESKLAVGSTFYFTFPDKGEVQQKVLLPTNIEKKPILVPEDKTILLVEDDVSNATLLKQLLIKSGMKVIMAADGVEAVEQCKSNQNIDLVLMDIKMPRMNGYTATRHIKAINKGLPVIAQTAYALINDRDKAFEAGCDAYITKPTHREDILKVVRQYLLPVE